MNKSAERLDATAVPGEGAFDGATEVVRAAADSVAASHGATGNTDLDRHADGVATAARAGDRHAEEVAPAPAEPTEQADTAGRSDVMAQLSNDESSSGETGTVGAQADSRDGVTRVMADYALRPRDVGRLAGGDIEVSGRAGSTSESGASDDDRGSDTGGAAEDVGEQNTLTGGGSGRPPGSPQVLYGGDADDEPERLRLGTAAYPGLANALSALQAQGESGGKASPDPVRIVPEFGHAAWLSTGEAMTQIDERRAAGGERADTAGQTEVADETDAETSNQELQAPAQRFSVPEDFHQHDRHQGQGFDNNRWSGETKYPDGSKLHVYVQILGDRDVGSGSNRRFGTRFVTHADLIDTGRWPLAEVEDLKVLIPYGSPDIEAARLAEQTTQGHESPEINIAARRAAEITLSTLGAFLSKPVEELDIEAAEQAAAAVTQSEEVSIPREVLMQLLADRRELQSSQAPTEAPQPPSLLAQAQLETATARQGNVEDLPDRKVSVPLGQIYNMLEDAAPHAVERDVRMRGDEYVDLIYQLTEGITGDDPQSIIISESLYEKLEKLTDPDFMSMLERYNDRTQDALSIEDRAFVERVMTLLNYQPRTALSWRYGFYGDPRDARSVAGIMHKDSLETSRIISRAKAEFADAASQLYRRRIDIQRWADDHHNSKSVLFLLDPDDEIPPTATVRELNGVALTRLHRNPGLNSADVDILADLYGLKDRIPKTISMITTRNPEYSREYIKRLEDIAIGRETA